MLRQSAHYNSIPRTPDLLLFAESLHGKWVPHLLHLRHQPDLPSLQRPGGVIQVLPRNGPRLTLKKSHFHQQVGQGT